MTEEERRIRAMVLELWNTGNTGLTKQIYTERAERRHPNSPEPVRGPDAIGKFVSEVHTGFPDFHIELKETVTEGDRTVYHWNVTGTHRGEFAGIPPTGKRISIDGLTMSRIEGGKIAGENVYFDRVAMLEQLGVAVPQKTRAGKATG
jgi:steroid delta-isomerase-like uncharacterized protein